MIPTDTNMVQMVATFCGKVSLTKKEYAKIYYWLEKLEEDLDDGSN